MTSRGLSCLTYLHQCFMTLVGGKPVMIPFLTQVYYQSEWLGVQFAYLTGCFILVISGEQYNYRLLSFSHIWRISHAYKKASSKQDPTFPLSCIYTSSHGMLISNPCIMRIYKLLVLQLVWAEMTTVHSISLTPSHLMFCNLLFYTKCGGIALIYLQFVFPSLLLFFPTLCL